MYTHPTMERTYERSLPPAVPPPLTVDVEWLAARIRETHAMEQAKQCRQTNDLLRKNNEDFEEERQRSTCLGRCWLLIVRCLGKPEEFKNNMRFREQMDEEEAAKPLLISIARFEETTTSSWSMP